MNTTIENNNLSAIIVAGDVVDSRKFPLGKVVEASIDDWYNSGKMEYYINIRIKVNDDWPSPKEEPVEIPSTRAVKI